MTRVRTASRLNERASAQSPPTTSPVRRPALEPAKAQAVQTGMPVENTQCVQQCSRLGGCDAAAAVGLHPLKPSVRLWMEKTGRAEHLQPLPAREDQPTYWTQMFEPIVAAYYTRVTGRRVRRVSTLVRHPRHEWMFARVEREVLDHPDVQLLSYLFVGPRCAPLWAQGMPDHVRLQAMHELAVTGCQAIEMAVFMCGEVLQIHRVLRDDTVIERLMALEGSFWRHVELGRAPPQEGFLAPEILRKVLRTNDPKSGGTRSKGVPLNSQATPVNPLQ